MCNKFNRAWAAALVLAACAAVAEAAAPAAPQGSITAKVFTDISGTAITDLTASPKFPNAPDILAYPPYFELWATGDIATAPAGDVGNSYGAQLSGYFYPTTTGDYTFYISADDNAELYLSTDDTPANKKLIAIEPQWNNPRDYATPGGNATGRDLEKPENSSATYTNTAWPSGNTISLQSGKAYYIEARLKEGGGGDNLSVSIDGTQPIPGSQLAPFNDGAAPTLATVSGSADFKTVSVSFSEGVDATAEAVGNYALDGGLTISKVTRVNATKVQLTTSQQVEGKEYTLTVNNVKDLSGTMITANSTKKFKGFVFVQGQVLHRMWLNNIANTIAGLTNSPRFPDHPSFSTAEPLFEYGPNGSNESGADYGNELTGWLTPSQTGDYVLYTSGDDIVNLFLSTDEDPANKHLIAAEPVWNNAREWQTPGSNATGRNTDAPENRSDTYADTTWPGGAKITLTAGKRYFVQILHTEGGGGDSAGMTWKAPGEGEPANGTPALGGANVGVYLDPTGAAINITKQPANTTVVESRTATLTIAASGSSAYGSNVALQWQKAPSGGSTFTNVPNATSATLTTPALAQTDSGVQYRVIVSVPTLSQTSSVATVMVQADQTAPKLNKVTVTGLENILVAFDEVVEKTSAETLGNYSISGGVTVLGATLGDTGTTVRLTTSKLTADASYTITVGGVKDPFNNAIPAGTTFNFVSKVISYSDIILADKPIAFYRFEETSGGVAKNAGTTGAAGDGLYMTGDSAGSASTGEGPRPPSFLGFDSANRSGAFTGANAGSEWIDTQNSFLQNRAAFTLEYWVKPLNRVGADPAWNRVGIVGQNDAVEYGFINGTTIEIWTPNGGSLDTPYSFPDNEWHHVATIADGKNLKTYFDGVLIATGGGATGNYGAADFTVHIGGGGVFDATGNYFEGAIDEVAIFDKAIPADRVAAHFKAGKEGGSLPSAEPGKFTEISLSGASITIKWSGEGVVQSAGKVEGPYADVTGATTSPLTINNGGGTTFYRFKP